MHAYTFLKGEYRLSCYVSDDNNNVFPPELNELQQNRAVCRK